MGIYCALSRSCSPRPLAVNILIVKLSSLGDVLHNLPVVWDVRARYPEAQVDWVVEEGYVDLLAPILSRPGFRGLDRIIPIALRRWKKAPFRADNRAEFLAFRESLRRTRYDRVIETQGLLKSALVCRLATRMPGAIVAGLANGTEYSGYEPMARLFYTCSVRVPHRCHAVERSRRVAAEALDHASLPSGLPLFYPPGSDVGDGVSGGYGIFFHATAGASKRWPEERWVALGRELADRRLKWLLPWGSPAERETSERLARQIPGAEVPPAFSLKEAFGLVAGASLVVGVDTGLTHLAAVLGRPTVELYCDSPRWKTEAYWSPRIANLGDKGLPPSVAEVAHTARQLLASERA